ncbi:MAG: hypothetical protein HYX27_02680 [Acidobacteria bacterium]|nr:hypothetical protein [Acidobacteriota bacterium]
MTCKLLFLTAAATISLAAEDATKKISANIWFPFDVNGVAMAAGKYEVVRTGHAPILTIRDVASRKSVMIVTAGSGASPIGTTLLTFHRHGDLYVLASVTDGRAGTVLGVAQSRKVKEIALTSRPEIITAPAELIYVARR